MQGIFKTVLWVAMMTMMSLGVWAGSMTIYTESGDEIWCEDLDHAMSALELKDESIQLGNGPVTIRLDEDLALSKTFDFSWIDRDITLDLNGNTLKSQENADWFNDELLNIELTDGHSDGHSFTLQDGTVTGAKTKGAIRIAAGQRVTIKNVTFENNHCDGNLSDLREGDVGGAIRCNSNLKIVGCTFRNNSCTTHGGAVGIYSNDYQSRFVIENCTFENNTAVEAGGALFLGCSGRIQNTTITGNTVTGREDGATQGQNETTSGQGGGVYLTRHGGVSYGDVGEGFWWGRFEGPTLQIEEGVTITGNAASLRPGAAARTNNLYLARHWESYNNAAVMVSGDTRAETRVGLTLSDGSGVFTRTLNEEGGEWLTDDYSTWFFSDAGARMRTLYDGEEGLMKLSFNAPAGEAVECKAGSAEEAKAQCTFVPAEDVAQNLKADDKAKYEAMFTPVATQTGDNTWSVTYELTEAATNVLQESVNTAQTAVLGAMTDPSAQSATVPARPGFYYAIEYGSDLNLGANTKGQMATGISVELDKPTDMPATRGFFRVKVSPSKIDSTPLNQ